MAPFQPPELSGWLSNTAGILPLSALIDFTDVVKKLHSYELSGRGLLWNWPVTPVGARLLLSDVDRSNACSLDHVGETPPLHCIDGRWGDQYPAHSAFTIRTCVSQTKKSFECGIIDPSVAARPQKLQVIYVLQDEVVNEETAELGAEEGKRGGGISEKDLGNTRSLTMKILQGIDKHGRKWFAISLIGWFFWCLVLAISLLAGLYIAASYLVVLVFTGFVIRYSHGHTARKLLDRKPSKFLRMVVLCDSMNGNDWVVFIGGHRVVDSLLNKPYYKPEPIPIPRIIRNLTRLFVIGQWGLTTVACGFQDWNAIVISAWIALCAFTSSRIYTEQNSVHGWLKANRVVLNKAEVTFGTRRAMLSALVALNPDRKSTKWIDPILAPSGDRKSWEEALIEKLEAG